MSEPEGTGAPGSADAAAVAPRRRGWTRLRWLWLLPLALIVAAIGGALWLDSAGGHRFLVRKIAELRQDSGLCFSVGRIDGSIYTSATLHDVALCDPQGVFLRIRRADLAWYPFAYLGNRLSIDRLTLSGGDWQRMPALKPSGKKGPILPGFDIFIGELAARDFVIEPAVAGRRQVANLTGSADVRDGRARMTVRADTNGDGDRLLLDADISPDDDRFRLKADVTAPAGGVLARVAGVARPLALTVNGDGSWTKWRGRLLASSAGAPVADLSLMAMAGRYTVTGTAVPGTLADGFVGRLTAPRVDLRLAATWADRILTLDGTAAAPAVALAAKGGYDFAEGGFDAMRIDARVRQPQVLLKDMDATRLGAMVQLDGPLGALRYDYRIGADAIRFGATGFTNARAAGQGRIVDGTSRIPVRFAADRVTGTGRIAERVLTDLRADGLLLLSGDRLTGRGITVRTRQIDSRADLTADLATGRYLVALDGRVRGFAIPGFGLVDGAAKLTVQPGGARGVSIAGRIAARMSRLDNGFLQTLGGGLPRLDTRIGYGADGVFRFSDFTIVAPKLRFAGNGVRNRDGTFAIGGVGRHAQYGALRMTLAGVIDRPRVVLDLESPFPAAGLRNVHAVLDPGSEGFAYTVAGGSTLGPFAGNGAILLPRGADPLIRIDELRVSQTIVRGQLRPGRAGLAGDVTIAGGGVNGTVALRPQGSGQAVEATIDMLNARFGGEAPVAIRRARVAVSGYFDPQRTSVDATVQAQGVSKGNFIIGRLAANAKITNGAGRVTASIAGTRGSTFDFQTAVDVTPGRYAISGNGSYQRRPLRIVRAAVLTNANGVWRLAPATLKYNGGSLRLAAEVGGGSTIADARLDRLPLQLADLANAELGFGGRATGVVTYAHRGGAQPQGGAKLTVTGLTRSGAALSSNPIDIGLNAALTGPSLALRAVINTKGETIGRVQARLSPLPATGALGDRIRNAPIFAQARFAGRADTLWRLTGVTLFDLTGPVSLGADISGTIANPQIRGAVRTDTARLQSALTGTNIGNLRTRGTFDGSRLVFSEFSGTTREGGTLSGTGSFDFSGGRGIGITMDIAARRAELLATDTFGATVTGPLTIRSDGSGGVIGGDLTLDRSRFALGRGSALAALPSILVREINARADAPLPRVAAAPWRLDIKARARNQMAVTGLGLDSEWRANLAIGGQVDNPRITGTADLVRGFYEFAGKSFRLERGAIRFTGEVPPDPTLDIQAVSEVQGIDATINVGGTGQRPEISFTSVPALPEDELLSRILFGSSITNISAAEALQLAAAVGSLRGGGGGGLDPINALRKAVGLDRLRILPADQITGQGTAIAAGKYITRRTYVELVTDGRGYSATRAEFQITRWLSILGSISTLGRQSVNVRVSRDY